MTQKETLHRNGDIYIRTNWTYVRICKFIIERYGCDSFGIMRGCWNHCFNLMIIFDWNYVSIWFLNSSFSFEVRDHSNLLARSHQMYPVNGYKKIDKLIKKCYPTQNELLQNDYFASIVQTVWNDWLAYVSRQNL